MYSSILNPLQGGFWPERSTNMMVLGLLMTIDNICRRKPEPQCPHPPSPSDEPPILKPPTGDSELTPRKVWSPKISPAKYKELETNCDGLAFVFFLDMKKCFDRIPRPAFFAELIRNGVDKDIVCIMEDMYRKTTLRAKTNDTVPTTSFKTQLGGPQGDPPSSCTWNVTYDHVGRRMVRSGWLYRIDT